VLPGGSLGGRGIMLIALAAWGVGLLGFFRVERTSLAWCLSFGQYTATPSPA